MAERKIGLRIELNGFRGVITNMKQLEDEIKKAKEDLQELEIGSGLFNELTGQIQRAETEMGKLRKQTEGISVEKQVEGYGKLAAGITGGFAAASAAVALFGNDTEEMSKAATQAQNLITLALSARSLAELKTGASIVATTIATRAEALATSLATKETWLMNTALKGLFTTIAANPIGALVAVIGLAITAMMAFGDETEKAVVDMKEINATTSEAAVKIEAYTKILKSSNSSEKTKLAIIKDLNKEMPGFNALLDENGKLTNIGNAYIKSRIKYLEAQAKAQALVNAIAKIETEMALNKSKSVEEQLTFLDKVEGKLYLLFSAYGAVGEKISNVENATKNAQEADDKLVKTKGELEKSLKAQYDVMGQIDAEQAEAIKLMEIQAKKEADAKNAKTKTNDATKEQIKNNERLNASMDSLKQKYVDEIESLKKLIEITQQTIPEPEIIKKLKKIQDAREAFKPADFDKVLGEFGLVIARTDDGLVALQDTFTELGDEFGKWYNGYTEIVDGTSTTIKGFEEEITDLFVNLEFKKVGEKVGEGLKKANEFFKEGVIDEAAYSSITKLILQYEQAVKLAEKNPLFATLYSGSTEGVNNATIKLQELNQTIFEVLEFEGQYGELSKERRAELASENKSYGEALKKREAFIKDYYQKLLAEYNKDKTTREALLEKEIKDTDLSASQKEELLKKLKTSTEKELVDLTEQIAKLRAEGLVNVIETIARGEAVIIKFNNEFNKIMSSGATDAQMSAIKLIGSNMESYVARVQKMRDTEFSKIQNHNKRIDELNKILAADGLDITKMSYDEKLKLLEAFIQAEEKMITEGERKKQYAIENTIKNLSFAIQEIQDSMSKISAITAQRFTLQLDTLTNEYNKDMANIVEDTKEANDKRIELEKIYQQQKKEIEKQAEITALKFSMAQAIADGAQAVLNIWSTHAANPILAGVLTGIAVGITAYQVDTINQQLQMVSSMRRGGILMGGGGLAGGASHEQGGIYAGGGSYIEGNEAIINRQSTLQYSGLLSQINQSGGGRPIMVQSPMDSRLVEALAKQNQTPIRAFVIERDITKAQSVNKRLEQLASF